MGHHAPQESEGHGEGDEAYECYGAGEGRECESIQVGRLYQSGVEGGAHECESILVGHL